MRFSFSRSACSFMLSPICWVRMLNGMRRNWQRTRFLRRLKRFHHGDTEHTENEAQWTTNSNPSHASALCLCVSVFFVLSVVNHNDSRRIRPNCNFRRTLSCLNMGVDAHELRSYPG